MNLRELRAAALKAAQDIITGAQKDGGRELTASESETVQAKFGEIDSLDAKIAGAKSSDDLMARICGLAVDATASGVGSKRLSLNGSAVAAKALNPDGNNPRGLKSLLVEGTQVVPAQFLDYAVVKERPPTSLLDVIPAKIVDRNFSYLRQTVRTNNAAPVAVGGLKPTSVYTMERVTGRLRVMAHLSEAIDEYWLADQNALQQFVSDELAWGLRAALEQQVIAGNGVGENATGFGAASGIQTQAFSVDGIQTSRAALTKVEALGLTGQAFILHPSDWQAIETRTTTTGAYVLEASGAPIDRAKRTLWGVQVALSTAVPVGTGYLLGEDSVILFTDGALQLKWGTPGDDFSRNQVRARLETRFDVGVPRPLAVVRMTLTGP
ncbi:MAG: phage major capsid protein [Nakamurella sp.]